MIRDDGEDTHRFYHSLMHGPAPVVRCFESMDTQANAVLEAIKEHDLKPEACCVIARTRKEVMSIRAALESRSQVCHTLDGRASNTPDNWLNVATMHRVKGLEFDAVFLASANKGLVPFDFVINTAADPVTRRQLENEERALVYVSLTRARKLAYVFAVGEMSPWFSI